MRITLKIRNTMKAMTLATLETSFQAEVLQGALSNKGIESFTRDDIFASIFSDMPGSQVEVLVFAKDYQQAFEVFKQDFPDLAEHERRDIH